jgi:hypothetical protein
LPIKAASSYTSSTVKFVSCCRIGDEHVIFRMVSIGVDGTWLFVGMFGRKRLSLVCETRPSKCSVDDDEDRSNQMIISSLFFLKKKERNLSDEHSHSSHIRFFFVRSPTRSKLMMSEMCQT